MLLFLDLAVKGSVVLVAALVGSLILRRASAASRCLLWSASLAGLLLLPLLGALVPAWTPSLVPEVPRSWAPERSLSTKAVLETSKLQNDIVEMAVLPRPTPRAPAVAGLPSSTIDKSAAARTSELRREQARSGDRRNTTTEIPAGKADPQSSPSLQRATTTAVAVPTWLVLLAGSYFLGVAALLLQLLAGTAGVVRIIRAARPVPDGPLRRDFEHAVAELGIERDIRFLETDATPVPVAWELWRPAVLMPRGAQDWPEQRRRVALLHELAHVRRRDCQMQLVAQLALALHWPNPLVWRAVRRLRVEREHACDDAVLSLGTRASDYAEQLLVIARGLLPREPAWASVAMARTPQLEGRVAAILDPENPRRLPQRRTIMTFLIAALALFLPLAAVQPGVAAQTPAAEPAPAKEIAAVRHLPETAGHLSGVAEHLTDVAEHLLEVASHFWATPEHAADISDHMTEMAGKLHAAEPSARAERGASALQSEPTIDELVQMRIHGVSTDFIRAVRDAFGRPVTTRELVQMRIHGASPEFVAGIQEEFPDEDITIGDVTNLRIHGASEDYVREMSELLGDEELDVHDVTQMRIHGVTTELVRDLQKDGFDDLTADDLVRMRIHGFDRWLQRRRGGR